MRNPRFAWKAEDARAKHLSGMMEEIRALTAKRDELLEENATLRIELGALLTTPAEVELSGPRSSAQEGVR